MGEAAVLVRLEQDDINKNNTAQMREMEKDIEQLQRDILDQDATKKEQRSKISHLEKVIEDLIDRVTKAEDRANITETSTQRATRSNASQQQLGQLESTLKTQGKTLKQMEERLEETELIVE